MKKNYVIAASCTTIGEFKKLIEDLPEDTKIYCSGYEEYYLNVDVTKNIVTIDTENFNEYYGIGEW